MTRHDLSKPVIDFITAIETSINKNCTIETALNSLRDRKISNEIIYFYVVDDEGKLVGIVPTRKLLLGKSNEKISSLMNKSIVSISTYESLGTALELFEKKKLLAIPVVNEKGILLGTLDIRLYSDEHNDVTEKIDKRHDLFQLLGLQIDQLKQSSSLREFRIRVPWLSFNILGGLGCAFIISRFEHSIAKAVLISMFIPMVLTLSESIAIQSMTMTLNYLHKPNIPWSFIRTFTKKEIKVALMIGGLCGLIAFLTALVFSKGYILPIAIGGSILISMFVTTVLGILFPVLLHIFRLDPKIAAGPIILVVGDIFTTFTYLYIASYFTIDILT